MAKRGLGKFVAFAAISGAVAAGVSYVLQYKIYHKELDRISANLKTRKMTRTILFRKILTIRVK